MYQTHEEAVDRVMNYLTINNYTTSIVYTHKRCYRLLKDYLESIKMPYSLEFAINWLKTVSLGLCQFTFKNYRLAVFRVNDSINHCKNTKNAYMAIQHYRQLNRGAKKS